MFFIFFYDFSIYDLSFYYIWSIEFFYSYVDLYVRIYKEKYTLLMCKCVYAWDNSWRRENLGEKKKKREKIGDDKEEVRNDD